MKKIINYRELVLIPLVELNKSKRVSIDESQVLDYKENLNIIFDQMDKHIMIDTYITSKERFEENYKNLINIYEKNGITKYSLKSSANIEALDTALINILGYDIYSIMTSSEALSAFVKTKRLTMSKRG